MIRPLTLKRDLQIVELLRSGLSRKEIAFELNITYANVDDAIRRNVRDRRRSTRLTVDNRNFRNIPNNNSSKILP